MPSAPTVLPTSFVTFYQASHQAQDEVFLLYSKELEKGPCGSPWLYTFDEGRARGIYRDGIGSPWMWTEDMRRKTTDPEEQRRGCWLIDRGVALKLEKESIERKRGDPEVRERIKEDIREDPDRVLDDWLGQLNCTPDYMSEFGRLYGKRGYHAVGMQGCGNLTMNAWFVAFLNSDFTGNRPVFLYRREEPFETRKYTCLIKCKGTGALSIAPVRFNLNRRRIFRVETAKEGAKPDTTAEVERDITEETEFAVFGQQVVENGQLVDFKQIANQFDDIRHLFKLPNINPCEIFNGLGHSRQAARPRMLFGDDRRDDVWFGEREMIAPGKEDLLRHALTEPILLDRQLERMGAGWDLIRAAFSAATGGGYRELKDLQSLYAPRSRGEWRRYSETMMEIFLQRNVYAYTMLGLDGGGNLIASAAAGKAGQVGQTLEAMAQNVISMGAQDILLMDEGNDVFQWVNGQYTVEPRRARLRAVFVVGQKAA